jgi:hypothetical protein
LSILIAVRIPVPARFRSPRGVKRLGGLTIALFAFQVLGLPIPFWVPLAVFAVGLMLLFLFSPRQDAGAAQVTE